MPRLPQRLQLHLEKLLAEQLLDAKGKAYDFSQPVGAEAWLPADSISWKVFSNPVSLLIGGIAAVILELAEPRVRTGVWEHTAFRTEPLARMRRTGLAAMITVYAPRDAASHMILGIRKRHDQVRGITPEGLPYRANDPELLTWVHATACFGFLEAYHHYVRPLSKRNVINFMPKARPSQPFTVPIEVPPPSQNCRQPLQVSAPSYRTPPFFKSSLVSWTHFRSFQGRRDG